MQSEPAGKRAYNSATVSSHAASPHASLRSITVHSWKRHLIITGSCHQFRNLGSSMFARTAREMSARHGTDARDCVDSRPAPCAGPGLHLLVLGCNPAVRCLARLRRCAHRLCEGIRYARVFDWSVRSP